MIGAGRRLCDCGGRHALGSRLGMEYAATRRGPSSRAAVAPGPQGRPDRPARIDLKVETCQPRGRLVTRPKLRRRCTGHHHRTACSELPATPSMAIAGIDEQSADRMRNQEPTVALVRRQHGWRGAAAHHKGTERRLAPLEIAEPKRIGNLRAIRLPGTAQERLGQQIKTSV